MNWDRPQVDIVLPLRGSREATLCRRSQGSETARMENALNLGPSRFVIQLKTDTLLQDCPYKPTGRGHEPETSITAVVTMETDQPRPDHCGSEQHERLDSIVILD